jgi:UDP-N-acetylmuramoyl-L-alanyl-D-glutamate--2,6-diaminopimelate ligase
MAAAAEHGADAVVVTSDNPRTENADLILADVAKGFAKPPRMIEVDRRLAIYETIARAQPQDVVLIAGKGHEDYQIIGTVKHPFSDQTEARVAQRAYVARHARGLTA